VCIDDASSFDNVFAFISARASEGSGRHVEVFSGQKRTDMNNLDAINGNQLVM
jgi:hypothetical protein